jgi:hypothetical protein
VMNPKQYPTRSERDNFYVAYLQSGLLLDGNSTSISSSGKAAPSSIPHKAAETASNEDSDSPTPSPSTPTDPPTPTDTPSSNGLKLTATPQSFAESPVTTPSISRQSSSAYFSNAPSITPTSKTPPLTLFTKIRQDSTVLPAAMDLLEDQVMRWMPASHALWGIWGLVQGKESVLKENERMDRGRKSDVDGEEEEVTDFDYLLYASGRIRIFRDACHAMGVF